MGYFKEMSGYLSAQRAYDNQLPPEYDNSGHDEDCDDCECGQCISDRQQDYEDMKADAAYDRMREDRI